LSSQSLAAKLKGAHFKNGSLFPLFHIRQFYPHHKFSAPDNREIGSAAPDNREIGSGGQQLAVVRGRIPQQGHLARGFNNSHKAAYLLTEHVVNVYAHLLADERIRQRDMQRR